MPGYNKVIMIGNLTRDPALTFLPGTQTPLAEFGLAVNRKWTDGAGQKQEKVCFIDCKVYGKKAETLNQYAKKGHLIQVDGELDFDQWKDQSGNDRKKHSLKVLSFQFLTSQQGQDRQAPPPTTANQPGTAGGSYRAADSSDDVDF